MQNLFAEFSPTTYADWQNLLLKALKNQPLQGLDWQVDKHLNLKPYYEKTTDNKPITWSKSTHWAIGERFVWAGVDIDTEKNIFLNALQTGTNTAEIELAQPAIAHLGQYLEGVWLDMIVINWRFKTQNDIAAFAEFCQKKGINETLQGHFLLENASIKQQFELFEGYKSIFPKIRFFSLTLAVNNHSRAENLAQILVEIYQLYQLVGDIRQVAENLRLELTIGAHFWVEIVQIRALKKLWIALSQSLGESSPFALPQIQAETQTYLTDNEHYNQIVATSQALSAAIARVDTLLVCPRETWAKAAEESRRLGKNIQHILAEESHINAVSDAAAGSFYLENATQQLLTNAWQLFQQRLIE